MIHRWLLFIMLSMCVNNIFSQKIERVYAEYTYYVPENISLDEGKRTALERAKIQALSDAFGTIVSQSNSTIVKSDNGKSDVDFLCLSRLRRIYRVCRELFCMPVLQNFCMVTNKKLLGLIHPIDMRQDNH